MHRAQVGFQHGAGGVLEILAGTQPRLLADDAFARRWNRPESVRSDEQGFRDDANRVLRMVHERMQRENRDFYPRIEAA